MMAHDNFFSSLPENGKARMRSHGYDSLAKARRTLREHSARRARVTPRVTLLTARILNPALRSFLACAGLPMRVPRWGTDPMMAANRKTI